MPDKQLMLDGYCAIQYYTHSTFSASAYTEDVQLIFVLQGRLSLSFGRERYDVHQNEMALIKRNIWVESNVGGAEESQLRYLRFIIKPELVKEFAKWTELPGSRETNPVPVMAIPAGSGWRHFALSLEPFLDGSSHPQPGLIRIKMLELLFHLSTAGKGILEQLMDLRDPFRPNITAAVEENILNTMSIGQLATMSGRSLSSFRRDFAAIYHMPPSQWIKVKRLEKAREMLSGTNMTVTEISYITGFSHIAHFSRLFKAHFGFPPSNCRQRC